jgi:tetratricopeptide (TPR) repeat protein
VTTERRCYLLWSLVIALWATTVFADLPAERLAEAWREYGFQAFGQADRLFESVEEAEQATVEDRFQARLGRALIVHNQMPGRNPETAISLYEQLLEQTETDSLRAFIHARLGDCAAEIRPPDLAVARQQYRVALDLATPGSLLMQETALRLVTTYMQRPLREDFLKGLETARSLEADLKGTALSSVLYGLQAELALFVRDPRAMVRALELQHEAGIHNTQIKERVLFQLARVYEVELGDYERAVRYYHALVDEVPTSQKAYFAGLRAAELERGQIVSDIAPPPREGTNE